MIQQVAFFPWAADELQAKGQALLVEPDGNGDAGKPCEVHRHGKDVVEIHLDRVGIRHLAQTKGGGGGGGRQDRVHSGGEGLFEVALDEGADLAGAVVIGVVEACGQHIGPDHDAALDFLAEAFGAGFFVHLGDAVACRQLGAVAVADAVIAGEVGRRLGRGDDVIGGEGVFRVGERDVHDLGPGVAQHGGAVGPKLFNLGRHTIQAIFARHANAQPLHTPRTRRGEIRHGLIGAGGILGVMPCHGPQQNGAIFHRARKGAGLVKR